MPLESHANLVPVRVVVHDSSGHAVENLQKDDFQVKQDGKLQFITHFSVVTGRERRTTQVARGEAIRCRRIRARLRVRRILRAEPDRKSATPRPAR